jgi:hypothetical protein
MRLKLFCGQDSVPDGVDHVHLLDPFLGFRRYDPEGNYAQIAAPYFAHAAEIFEMAPSMETADAALLAVDWMNLTGHDDARRRAWEFMQRAADAGKQCIVFFTTDAPVRIAWPENAVVFRIAVHRSWRGANEFIMPQWSKDYLRDELGGEQRIRAKTDTPVVSFCGYAPPLGMRWSSRRCKEALRLTAHYAGLLRFFPTRSAHAARARALVALRGSRMVRTSFLIRDESAFANLVGAFLPGGSVEAAARQRREFVDNIIGGDYVLCSRGYANCSIRFTETLSLGRIPVLVDTDCVLPFGSGIDWNKFCVIVKERDLPRIGRRVREFHDALSPAQFEELQRACRRLWEEWISPLGFFQNMNRCLGSVKAGYA